MVTVSILVVVVVNVVIVVEVSKMVADVEEMVL